MDLRRLRAGEWIAATAGVVLAVALFLPWYDVGGAHVTAWEAYTVVDVLLFATALAGIGLAVLTAVQPTAAVGVAADSLLTIVASVLAIVALLRFLNLPGGLDDPALGAGRAAFAWVGLAASFGVAIGALVAMRDERLSKPGRPTDPSGVPISAPPEVEALPAPPREAPQP